MALQRAKPAPGKRQRASGDVFAGATDKSQNSNSPRFNQPGAQEVYDGTRHAGSLIPRGSAWLAYASDGRFLGARASSRLAARLIYEGHRPGGTR